MRFMRPCGVRIMWYHNHITHHLHARRHGLSLDQWPTQSQLGSNDCRHGRSFDGWFIGHWQNVYKCIRWLWNEYKHFWNREHIRGVYRRVYSIYLHDCWLYWLKLMVLESLVIVSILAFLNAFLIIGFYLSCSYNEHEGQIYDKMILWRFHKWVRSIVGDWWAKPVCGCVPCMASLHSIIPFLIIANNNNLPLWIWPLYALTVSGIAKLIHSKIE